MKNYSRLAAGVAAVIGFVAPLSAFAAFADGMVIPSGTTAAVTTALPTYFFSPLLATIFQAQVIEILLVMAAVYLCYRLIRMIINKAKHPQR